MTAPNGKKPYLCNGSADPSNENTMIEFPHLTAYSKGEDTEAATIYSN